MKRILPFLGVLPAFAQIGATPRITSIAGAGASVPAVTQVSAGGIISIYGTNFTPVGVSYTLQASDLIGNNMPTNLAQTCVQVGGAPAALYYVSSTQINAQVTAVSLGAAQVTVVSNCGTVGQATSQPVTVQVVAAAPEFLYYKVNANGQNPVVAVEATSGGYVGPPGLIAGASFAPAKPNDVLVIYGVGFGATSPAVAPGTLATAASTTVGNPLVTIGGVTATVLYAGLTPGYAGLYQLNVEVPMGVSAGNQPISMQVNGGGSPTGGYITIAGTNPQVMSISISGNQFIDAAGNVIHLQGVNLSGMEFTAIQGWDPGDPTGGNFGQPNNPKWSAIQAWKANIVRIPLNESSWLGLTCTDIDGFVRHADPGNNYQASLANMVKQANAAGMYVILDLHWAAPGTTCPMGQAQMADADHSIDFWTSVANAYKSNPAVMFDLFNEPFISHFTGDQWGYIMYGTNGSFSGFPAYGRSGSQQTITTAWKVASYQDMINAVRATGAANVVLIGSLSYTADLSGWLSHMPNDPSGQIAAAWHPYPTYGAAFGTPQYAQPGFAPQVFTEVKNIMAAGIPVLATETGDQDTAGTPSAPLVQTITQFVDANSIGLLGWTWDVWTNPNDVLIKDVNGTPTDGYGVFFKNWMVNHP
ncbi:MAG TPA: cellulase family glycosylhydrolase [Bryobacteraceae bacterium]|nr:cellulase family glycosylhydrolase [Bryobacteraceae bacterium]